MTSTRGIKNCDSTGFQALRVHTTFNQRSRGVNAAVYDKAAGHNNILGIDDSDKTQITSQ